MYAEERTPTLDTVGDTFLYGAAREQPVLHGAQSAFVSQIPSRRILTIHQMASDCTIRDDQRNKLYLRRLLRYESLAIGCEPRRDARTAFFCFVFVLLASLCWSSRWPSAGQSRYPAVLYKQKLPFPQSYVYIHVSIFMYRTNPLNPTQRSNNLSVSDGTSSVSHTKPALADTASEHRVSELQFLTADRSL